MQCLNCGSSQIAPLKPESGDRYLLTEVDSEKNSVNVGTGILVDIIACTNCGYIHLMNENFKGMKITPE